MDDPLRHYKAKLELGFRVKELIGGLDCWRYDGYPIDGLETAEPAGSCGCS